MHDLHSLSDLVRPAYITDLSTTCINYRPVYDLHTLLTRARPAVIGDLLAVATVALPPHHGGPTCVLAAQARAQLSSCSHVQGINGVHTVIPELAGDEGVQSVDELAED